MNFDWQPLILSIELSAVTTVILLVIGIPVGYYLATSRTPLKPLWQTFVSMPIVLPPTVLGFYLLIALGPASWLGQFIESVLGLRFVFSFEGLVIASVIYSLPFMVNPIQSGFEQLPSSLREASLTLGKSPFETFARILLPNIRSSLVTGAVVTFAHTMGEFGVVLMVGGNIPGVTRVASIAVYNEFEALNFQSAGMYSLILLSVTFIILLSVHILQRRSMKVF